MAIFETYTTVTASFDDDLKPITEAICSYQPEKVIKLIVDFYKEIKKNIKGAKMPKTIYFDCEPLCYINEDGYTREIPLDKIYAFFKIPREMGLRFARKCCGKYKYENAIYGIYYNTDEDYTFSNYGYIEKICNVDDIKTIGD